MKRLGLILLLCAGLAMAAPSITTQKIHESGRGWKVDVAYPQLSGQPRFNKIMHDDAVGMVAGFERDARADKDPRPLEWTLTQEVHIASQGNGWISVERNSYMYTGQGNHGSPAVAVDTYNLQTGRFEHLQDWFKPDTNYLQVIASYVRDIARQRYQYSEDMLAEGTKPVLENFRDCYPKHGALVFVFQPYQVGPYAAGEPEIDVPLSYLGSLLRPGGLPTR